jgi:Protein of unknown function (DUF1566)
MLLQKKTKKALLALLFLMALQTGFAQNIGIGTTNPNPNALLDISSGSQGLLAPRMDSTSRKNIPATKGLLVYDTTYNSYWFNNGAAWVNMPPAGTGNGSLLYWNGSRWVSLAPGVPGQYLTYNAGGTPIWSGAGTMAISTTAASGITQTAAQSGGSISTDGGAAITARGVVWSRDPNPTIALATKTNDGSGTGTFTSNITGLTAGYTYYVRSYATNANGTTYGNQINFVTTAAAGPFTIGQSYGGGIIFYIDGSGQHGLIAAPVDQSAAIRWTPAGVSNPSLTNAAGFAIGTGAANTTTIINIQGSAPYAATLCRLYYNGGGFTDWYLPSIFELNQLFLQRTAVGGFPDPMLSGPNYYWSSSESSTGNAWAIDFNNNTVPTQTADHKLSYYRVRAVRAF